MSFIISPTTTSRFYDYSIGTSPSSTVESVRKPCCENANRGEIAATFFTPKNASGTVSLTTSKTIEKRLVSSIEADNLTIPANAIIDKVEFFGINGFQTKGTFAIGLGQLNDSIKVPLIENATATIANEKVGGCRQFLSIDPSGVNVKNIVLYPMYVNVLLEHPVMAGHLQVIVYYHVKTI